MKVVGTRENRISESDKLGKPMKTKEQKAKCEQSQQLNTQETLRNS